MLSSRSLHLFDLPASVTIFFNLLVYVLSDVITVEFHFIFSEDNMSLAPPLHTIVKFEVEVGPKFWSGCDVLCPEVLGIQLL